jgi:hypothetical protein
MKRKQKKKRKKQVGYHSVLLIEIDSSSDQHRDHISTVIHYSRQECRLTLEKKNNNTDDYTKKKVLKHKRRRRGKRKERNKHLHLLH